MCAFINNCACNGQRFPDSFTCEKQPSDWLGLDLCWKKSKPDGLFFQTPKFTSVIPYLWFRQKLFTNVLSSHAVSPASAWGGGQSWCIRAKLQNSASNIPSTNGPEQIRFLGHRTLFPLSSERYEGQTSSGDQHVLHLECCLQTFQLSVVTEAQVHKGNGANGLTFAAHADRQNWFDPRTSVHIFVSQTGWCVWLSSKHGDK